MKTNTAITVYNKYISAGVEAWQRTVIPAAQWENRKAANVIKSGMLEADSVVIFVLFLYGSAYLKQKAWQALTTKTGYWTLQVGDYIVKGSVADEITTNFTITDLKAKYDDVVKITTVDTLDYGSAALQHWQVGAK
jgi:hypothetical protein